MIYQKIKKQTDLLYQYLEVIYIIQKFNEEPKLNKIKTFRNKLIPHKSQGP